MKLEDFKCAVAHYMDGEQIEKDSLFYTALSGGLIEVLQRFPVVKSLELLFDEEKTQTAVNMNELATDFASFSTPVFYDAELSSPCGRPLVDARTGQIIFPPYSEGRCIVFYNAKAPIVNRDTEDIQIEGERLELLTLSVAYRLLLVEENYDMAAEVKRIYNELCARIEAKDRGVDLPVRNVYGW